MSRAKPTVGVAPDRLQNLRLAATVEARRPQEVLEEAVQARPQEVLLVETVQARPQEVPQAVLLVATVQAHLLPLHPLLLQGAVSDFFQKGPDTPKLCIKKYAILEKEF